MNEIEARVRCLELGASINKALGNHSAEGVVEIATVLYNFAQASPQAERSAENADKPKRGRQPKAADILS